MSKNKKQQKSSHPAPSPRHTRVITEVLGWYGASAVLLAYGLTSFGVIDIHHLLYLILNFTGALGILAVASAKHVRQSMLVNTFWAAMAGLALVKIILQV